jgi:hypothetical protein
MTLRYGITPQPVGLQDENLQPGTCTWNEQNYRTVPREPGYVTFDIHPLAQAWFATNTRQLDTTVNAAINFPDTISIRKYLSSSDKYWRFFVDDATNFSDSYNPTKTRFDPPTFATVTGAYPFTSNSSGIATETTETTKPEAAATPRTTPPKKTAPAVLAKLSFKRLTRTRDGFSVLFTARPNAAVRVSYSTSRPVKTPQGWYFEGAAVQGSGAVSRGGFDANVMKGANMGAFAQYTGTSRLPLQRGTDYNFLITVEGNGPLEQYLGQFKSMQQDIRVSVTSFTVTNSSVTGNVVNAANIFANKDGSFVYCGDPCENAPDVIGLLVFAHLRLGTADPPTSWTALPGKNSGVGKITIDTRMISMDRPFRSFTVNSLEGDIEFEAIGQIQVNWH